MDSDTKAEILYHLNLLLFLRSETADNQRIYSLIDRIATDHYDNIPCEQVPNTIVEKCDNEILKLAYIRKAKDVIRDGSHIVHNKKRYRFDNVFVEDEHEQMVGEMVTFIEKRIRCGVDSTIINFGLSGSGKTTLMKYFLLNLEPQSYSLCEIYLNKRNIYKRGSKVPAIDEKEEYVFKTKNIMDTLERFVIKKDNGQNATSSRAHIILTLYFESCKVTIIDLCGNEKVISMELKDESKYINKSLFNVSSYLKAPTKYRDNKCQLLNILKKSTNIVCNILFHDTTLTCASTLLNVLKSILS